jgi:hypothetical protein
VFDLSVMQPYNLDYMLREFSKITKEIAAYLPRNSDLEQIANYRLGNQNLPIIHYCMRGASKVCYIELEIEKITRNSDGRQALVAYYGDFSATPEA